MLIELSCSALLFYMHMQPISYASIDHVHKCGRKDTVRCPPKRTDVVSMEIFPF